MIRFDLIRFCRVVGKVLQIKKFAITQKTRAKKVVF